MTRAQFRLIQAYSHMAADYCRLRRLTASKLWDGHVGTWGHLDLWCHRKWGRGPLELNDAQARHGRRQLNAWRARDAGIAGRHHSVDANKMVPP